MDMMKQYYKSNKNPLTNTNQFNINSLFDKVNPSNYGFGFNQTNNEYQV